MGIAQKESLSRIPGSLATQIDRSRDLVRLVVHGRHPKVYQIATMGQRPQLTFFSALDLPGKENRKGEPFLRLDIGKEKIITGLYDD